MKKYTILDSTGQKKIVYAPNMKKALRYVGDGEKTVKDSKIKDEDDYFYFDADEDDRSLDDYKRIMKQCGLTITKVEGNNREAFIYYRGSSSAEQKAAKMLGISLEDSIKDSKFYAEEDATEAKKRAAKYGLQVKVGKKVSSGPNRGFDEIYYIGPKDKLTKMLKVEGFDDDEISNMIEDSKVKDADANIVDKLIGEEEKAVMDYKEALMADSDLSANAVYAHILAEELEHLKELRSLKEQPSLGDSIDDAKWNTYNAVNYKFERNYWHIFSIFNRIEMPDNKVRDLARKLNLIVEPYDKYSFKRHNKNDNDVYYDDYRVKGKDKNNVIKFCETLNPLVKPLTFE